MRRNTPKRAKADRAAYTARRAYAELHPCCGICGELYFVQTHEITSGPGRAWGFSHREAWLRLCGAPANDCHGMVQSEWSSQAMMARQYALKYIRDVKFYDRHALNVARGRDPEAITADDVRAAHKLVKDLLKW